MDLLSWDRESCECDREQRCKSCCDTAERNKSILWGRYVNSDKYSCLCGRSIAYNECYMIRDWSCGPNYPQYELACPCGSVISTIRPEDHLHPHQQNDSPEAVDPLPPQSTRGMSIFLFGLGLLSLAACHFINERF